MGASKETNKFVEAVGGLSPEEKMRTLEEIGVKVTPSEMSVFSDALSQILVPGTIDITDWNSEAIRTLLVVASKKDISINLRRGHRTISPLKFPSSEMFLEYLIDEVITEEPW